MPPENLTMGIKVKTTLSIERLEAWLAGNCRAGWHVVPEDVSEDLRHKLVTILFETNSDRSAFKTAYAGKTI